MKANHIHEGELVDDSIVLDSKRHPWQNIEIFGETFHAPAALFTSPMKALRSLDVHGAVGGWIYRDSDGKQIGHGWVDASERLQSSGVIRVWKRANEIDLPNANMMQEATHYYIDLNRALKRRLLTAHRVISIARRWTNRLARPTKRQCPTCGRIYDAERHSLCVESCCNTRLVDLTD